MDEDVGAYMHPENLTLAIRAAELFGLNIAGIDIINEVNLSPLFGGGEISRRHIPDFLKQFIRGDGRIPIELFEGNDGFALAQLRQAVLLAQGVRCFTTSAIRSVDQHQKELVMPLDSLRDRVKALLCRPDVDVLRIVCDG